MVYINKYIYTLPVRIYGTAQMQLHTHVCQTRELKIVTREWIVVTRELPFAYSRVQILACYSIVLFENQTHE